MRLERFCFCLASITLKESWLSIARNIILLFICAYRPYQWINNIPSSLLERAMSITCLLATFMIIDSDYMDPSNYKCIWKNIANQRFLMKELCLKIKIIKDLMASHIRYPGNSIFGGKIVKNDSKCAKIKVKSFLDIKH